MKIGPTPDPWIASLHETTVSNPRAAFLVVRSAHGGSVAFVVSGHGRAVQNAKLIAQAPTLKRKNNELVRERQKMIKLLREAQHAIFGELHSYGPDEIAQQATLKAHDKVHDRITTFLESLK